VKHGIVGGTIKYEQRKLFVKRKDDLSLTAAEDNDLFADLENVA
jgi:hypothetical protein